MKLEHTPLDPASLSPAARKAVAPGPAKMMAARGLAPLPRPADLITVLYQLALDDQAQIRNAAKKSADELPDKILAGALGDDGLDARVIDFFTARIMRKPELLELVVLNPAAADQTIAVLARRGSGKLVDLIASNEQRLLRHPEIVGAMYVNARARMSTVDRAVELAVRNEVRVPGIAAWDEIARSVLGIEEDPAQTRPAEEVDALFERVATAAAQRQVSADDGDDTEHDRDIPIREMSVPMKIRLALLGNSFARSVLIRDRIKMVAVAAIKSPGVTDAEALKYASKTSIADDVIKYIAGRRDWTRTYTMKLALVNNPKTPIPAAIRFLPSLRERDLKILSRSKGIPSAVAANARKLLMTRGGRARR